MPTIDLGELTTSEAAELHKAAVEAQAIKIGLGMATLSIASPETALATIARRRADKENDEKAITTPMPNR